MKSFLKTAEIVVDGIGELSIRELSAKNQIEMLEMQGPENIHVPAFVCKTCVKEWGEESVEDIEQSIGADALQVITTAIYDLSGIKLRKNSEPAPSDGSSTA